MIIPVSAYERNALIYERSLDINGLEAPGIALASLVGFAGGPADYRAEALGFGVASAPNHGTASAMDAVIFTSQAAAQGLSFSNHNIPLHTVKGFYPAQWRARRTYVFEILCNVTTGPGATGAHMGIHVNMTDLNGSTGAGVEWFAGSGVNGGRWTARYRRTGAPTAIQNVADSGILADATPHVLGFAYRQGDIAVDCYVDDKLITTITDPVSIVGEATVSNKLPSFGTAPGAAGTVLNVFGARIRVYRPDFPLYAADFSGQTPGLA